jgi:two-component system sensor histidine kinase KdpD
MGRLVRALAVLALASAIAVGFDGILGEGYISLIFLMAIMINGAQHGLRIAMISAALGAVGFDLLITEPKWVITYSHPDDLAAPLVFTLCALGSGMLSGRLKDEARRVHQRNLQLEALLEASRGMQRARSANEVASALSASVAAQTGVAVTLHDVAQGGAPDAMSGFVRLALASGGDRIDDGGLSAFPWPAAARCWAC